MNFPITRTSIRIPALDAMRGFAAVMIFIFHFFALYPAEKGNCWSGGIGVYISNFFGNGVPLFYALSGVSLYLGFFEKRNNSNFSRDFFIRRFLRIAPLFYIATFIWIGIIVSRGASVDPFAAIATFTFTFNLVPNLHESLTAAGWSIGVEMLFYAFFPIIVVFITDAGKGILFFLFAALVSMSSFVFLSKTMPTSSYPGLAFSSHLLHFATGIVVYFIFIACNSAIQKNRIVFCSSLAIFLIGSLYVLTSGLLYQFSIFQANNFILRYLWAVPIGISIFFTMILPWSRSFFSPFVKLGEWSFSIYLLHPILLYYMGPFYQWHQKSVSHHELRFFLDFVLSLIILTAFSAFAYYFIEKPFIQLSRKITSRSDQSTKPINTQAHLKHVFNSNVEN